MKAFEAGEQGSVLGGIYKNILGSRETNALNIVKEQKIFSKKFGVY